MGNLSSDRKVIHDRKKNSGTMYKFASCSSKYLAACLVMSPHLYLNVSVYLAATLYSTLPLAKE